ncbi:MAG: divergent polysaccharide deacetylase family protein [Desulfosalsimonas sp.]
MAKAPDSNKKAKPKSGSGKKTASGKKDSSKKASTGKRAAQSKSSKKAGGSKKARHRSIRWDFVVFACILAAVVALAGYYHLYFRPAQKPAETVSVPERPEPPQIPEKRPRVAIIIDDLGREKDIAEKFFSLKGRFTYAVLPGSTFQSEIADRAHRNGGEVMLHQPMEPRNYPENDPGKGALLSSMTADERISILKQHIDELPHVKGVNNHMGSKMSEESAHMNQILSIVKKRGLYYIDSLTTEKSRSLSSARLFRVPFAERDVFIDHVPDRAFIRRQLKSLVAVAQQKGSAVGICHPYPETYEVLEDELPRLKRQVRLVTASEVVSVRSQ